MELNEYFEKLGRNIREALSEEDEAEIEVIDEEPAELTETNETQAEE